jgi:3-oxoacyl-[acyl-carrier protein] reductase
MNLEKQVAIVTGASQGIGQTTAILLGSAKASVVVNYVGSDEGAVETVRKIEEAGGKAVRFNGDISVKENVEKMFQLCIEKFGKPDILVANAGVGVPPKPLVEITEEDFRFVYDVNVKGTIFCIIEALKQMNEGGRVVVVTSSTIVNPVEGLGIYISSKSALQAFVETAAPELGRLRGITINCVRPGVTVTPMTTGDLSAEFLNAVKEATPLKRLGTTNDVAQVIGFLCEKRSQWISGQHVTVNGGSKF